MLHRRHLLKTLTACGILSPVFERALLVQADEEKSLNIQNIKQAEWISGIELTDEQRKSILDKVKLNNAGIQRLRETVPRPHD